MIGKQEVKQVTLSCNRSCNRSCFGVYFGHASQLQIRCFLLFFFSQKVLIVSCFSKTTCCGYSLEVPHWSTSNEYLQHMFLWRNKKKWRYRYPSYILYLEPQAYIWLGEKYFTNTFSCCLISLSIKYWIPYLPCLSNIDCHISPKYLDTSILSTLGKIFRRWHFEIFFLFFPGNRIWQFM